jgi:hypothetical protein
MLARPIPLAAALALVTALGALGALDACAAAHRSTRETATPRDERAERAERDTTAADRDTYVRIENRHWLDLVVYAVRSGQRQRLGTVASGGTAAFRVPPDLIDPVGELGLYAHPVGAAGSIADRVVVHPGEQVQWTIESALAHSTIFVR